MTTAKSIALSAFGLLSTCFLAMPAFAGNAGSVTQMTIQDSAQIGVGNLSVQASDMTAIVDQSAGFPGFGGLNGGSVFQGTKQGNGQLGNDNRTIQGASSHGEVYQGLPGVFGDFNAGQIQQLTGQTSAQLGAGNQTVQGANHDAMLIQY
jgi:hypothetical protein